MADAFPGTVALVPELEVSNFTASLDFYVRLVGFEVVYDRPERPFAYLGMGSAHLMIEQGGSWLTGQLEKPLGRGINFQIQVHDAEALRDRLTASG